MSAEHKSIVGLISGQLPPPGKDDEDAPDMDEIEDDGDDKEADEMAKKSAFKDFLVALGLNPKKTDAAMGALEEFLNHCKDEDSDE